MSSAGLSIHKAAMEGQVGLVQNLLDRDPSLLNSKDSDGRTPLHWAASVNDIHIVQSLLEVGKANTIDLEARDLSGWTALMVATSAGAKQVVNELLNAGAQVDATNSKGQTALHYAASKGRGDVGKLLIEKGADINVKDTLGQQPLHRAATTGNVGFMNILINPPPGRPKTRLNGGDRVGFTPLHLALESAHGAAAVLLINAGADRERPDSDGKAPEDLEGVGGQEQKNVKAFIVSECGPRAG